MRPESSPLASGKRTTLTPEVRWDVETFEVSDDGGLMAYAINEDGFSGLRIVDRQTGRELARPELPRGVLTGLKFSPDGKRLALSMSTARSAGDVWTWDVAGGQLTRWTQSELGGLDPKGLAEPRLVRFKSFDGL